MVKLLRGRSERSGLLHRLSVTLFGPTLSLRVLIYISTPHFWGCVKVWKLLGSKTLKLGTKPVDTSPIWSHPLVEVKRAWLLDVRNVQAETETERPVYKYTTPHNPNDLPLLFQDWSLPGAINRTEAADTSFMPHHIRIHCATSVPFISWLPVGQLHKSKGGGGLRAPHIVHKGHQRW